MREFDKTILSQYSNSATLCQLITNLNTYIDPNVNLQNFYDLIWNIDTAEGYGLDVWGRIVGISRFIKVPNGTWFGFAEATIGAEPFDQGVFYDGSDLTHTVTLDDETYRTVIFAKAALNITDNSIPAVNQILLNLFPDRGNAYVIDGRNAVHDICFGFQEAFDAEGWDIAPFGDFLLDDLGKNMEIVYVFEFALTETEVAIVDNSGVLPRGAGVYARSQHL